ncbi:MAG: sugar transferase [Candidatus Sumerlaeota bacterium]|nr:sugar transferase [Candidatus Sumerlaeota bacterium]
MNRKRQPPWLLATIFALDMLSVAAGSIAAYVLRFHALAHFFPPRGGYALGDYLRLIPVALAAWALALRALGLYAGRGRVLDWKGVGRIFQAALGATGLFLAYVFFARPASAFRPAAAAEYSRAVATAWLASTFVSVVMARWAADRLVHHLRRHHQLAMARTLIVGGGPVARQAAKSLRRFPEAGRHVVGFVLPDGSPEHSLGAKSPILGSGKDLPHLIRTHQIDEVIVAQPDLRGERLNQLLAQCEKDLVEFRIVPDVTEMIFSGVVVEEIDGVPFLGLHETPLTGWNAFFKRLFDVGVSGVALAVLAAPMAAIAWLIRRDSPGSAFYLQERMGVDGRLFKIIKFRSMVQDAEEATGPIMARENDPRETRIGRTLRKCRIDEWPQLINVLLGHMSLVGPRPERPFFVSRFKESIPRYMARHKVKSGITGWAQVNGLCGPHGSIEQRVRYDIRYIEEWSWWLDFSILAKTAFARRSTPPVSDEAPK